MFREVVYPELKNLEDFKTERNKTFLTILWMLAHNQYCQWGDFLGEPLNIPPSTLGKRLKELRKEFYIERQSRNVYSITHVGMKYLREVVNKKAVIYTPEGILRKGNNELNIFYTLVHNNSCNLADFEYLNLSGRQLAKYLRTFMEQGLVSKTESDIYQITKLGNKKYFKISNALYPDLRFNIAKLTDNMNLINKFFKNFEIKNEDVKLRFLNNYLVIDSELNCSSDEIMKINYFLSIYHVDNLLNVLNLSEFSNSFDIEEKILKNYVSKLVEKNLFFELVSPQSQKTFYFRVDGDTELNLRNICEANLYKTLLTDIEPLVLINNIIEDVFKVHLFNTELKPSLEIFLDFYITKYLNIKFETKTESINADDMISTQVDDINLIHDYSSFNNDNLEYIKSISNDNAEVEKILIKVFDLIENERFDDAITISKGAVELDKKNYMIFNAIGYIYWRKKEYFNAINNFKKAIEIKPNFLSWKNILVNYINLGEDYWNKAIDAGLQAIKIAPEDDNTYYLLGRVYHSQNNLGKALDAYQNAITLNPENSRAWAQIGSIYQEMQKFEKSIECFKRSIGIDPNNELPWLKLARLYYNNAEFNSSIDAYKKSLRINPKNPITHFYLGMSYKNEFLKLEIDNFSNHQKMIIFKEFFRATTLYKQRLKRDHKNAEILGRLGILYRELGKFDKAIHYHQRAIKSSKNGNFYLCLAKTYFEMGDFNNALEIYKNRLRINPQSLRALENVGKVYFSLNNFDKAIKYFTKYLKLNQSNSEILKLLGDTYFNVDEHSIAIKYYKKASETNPNNLKPFILYADKLKEYKTG